MPLNTEDDRALIVLPTGEQVVLRCRDGSTDVAHPQRRTVLVADDQVVVRFGRQQLIVGIERVGLLRAIQCAFGEIDIGFAEHRAYGLETDAARGERLRVDLNANRRLLLPADTDQTDARNLRDLLHQDVFGVSVNGGQRVGIGGHRQHEDGSVGRIDLPDRWWIGHVRRQLPAGCVNPGQNIRGGAVDVATQIELHRDRGEAERARRGHLDDAGNLPELQLEGRCHG